MRLEHASHAAGGADGGHNEGGELHDDAENVHEERLDGYASDEARTTISAMVWLLKRYCSMETKDVLAVP